MGYQIYTGHHLESLVEAHADCLVSSFLGPRPLVVVQSQSLAQWLKLFLAQKRGGYATVDFLFQDEALRTLLEAEVPTGERILFLDDLKLALYRHLAEVLQEPTPEVYLPLISQGQPPDASRLFELADHIAGVFHSYAMNSELWPPALSQGLLPPNLGVDPRTFAWQSALWQELLDRGQGTLAGMVLRRYAVQPPPVTRPARRVVIVGSAFLSRRAQAFLSAWAEAGLIDGVHLLLLPAPASLLRSGLDQRPWASWGAFGRLFLQGLPKTEDLPGPEVGTTALAGLQRALAAGVSPGPLVPDGSLQVVSCPHPLRELEALRDRLLTALEQDPSLEVHEIAVLAPDINVYGPFFDAVFGSDDPGRRLRFHVIDLDLGKENTWFRALDALLALVSGTLDRPTLFTLIDTPAFQDLWKIEAADRDLWLDYTEEVSAWREDAQGSTQSWSASWPRLWTGWFRRESDTGAPPLDVAPSAFRSLARFSQLVETLRDRSHEVRRPRPFLEWVWVFESLTVAFLGDGDGTASVLSGRLRTLALDAGSPSEELPWAGFRAFVQDQIAHFSGRRGQLLTEGLHCSSLKPLRAIPFRVIALLGLDEGRFPHQSPAPQFDLRRYEPGQDALSGLAVDRYSFWETIMAARDLLYLSYTGRSPIDGGERPPSPVLADLLDFLEEGGTPWPLESISVKDFSVSSSQVRTWSPRTLRRAEAVGQRKPLDPPTPAPALPLDEVFLEVKSTEVVQAFTVPARFYLQRVRQIVLRDEDRRGVDDEEPWSLSFLDRQAWLQETLRDQWTNPDRVPDVDAFVSTLVTTGRVREGVFTERDRRELHSQALRMGEWVRGLLTDGWEPVSVAPHRTRWAEKPWAAEGGERLVRRGEVLVPRLLYSQSLPARTKLEAAVLYLLDPAASAHLATFNTRGESQTLPWRWDPSTTTQLARRAEDYWREAASRPLPFYPDFLEALAGSRTAQPWREVVETAWRKVKTAPRVRSESTLTHCPYAALAFPREPNWHEVTRDLETWWDDLFVPLMEAWS